MSIYREPTIPEDAAGKSCLRFVSPGKIQLILIGACVLAGAVPSALGGENSMTKRALPDCPDTPNCVSSQAIDSDHYIAPLRYHGPAEAAKSHLLDVINGFSRTRVIENTANYISVTFTSRLFGFTDDVEFQFDDRKKLIHMRSASRTGYFDLGANRRRCERLRESFSR